MMGPYEVRSIPTLGGLRNAGCVLALAAGILVGGCQHTADVRTGPDITSFAVGVNEIGEPCKAAPGSKGAKEGQAEALCSVSCGKWQEPSGRVFVAGGGDAAELAKSSWWRDRLEGFANCGQPIATSILDGVHAYSLDCTFRVGGWPYQAFAARIGDRVYLAESIPAAYAVTERAVGVLAGKLTPSQGSDKGSVSAEMKRLEGRLASAQYSIGDLESYRDLLRLAQHYNFQNDFPSAEQKYLQALRLQQKVVQGDLGEKGFLEMHIALELSNQGQFNIAEEILDQAETVVRQSMEPTDEARLVSYRALHLANQRRDQEALALARRATELRRVLAREYGYSPSAASAAAMSLAAVGSSRHSAGSANVLSSRAATALGDIVQSRYLEAAMLVELKQYDAAHGALNEAQSVMELEPRVPRSWLPRIRFLQARIAENKGDWSAAERLLASSIEAQSSLFSESRMEGLARVALGRVYAAQGRPAQALESFRAGFSILGKLGAGIRFDFALPYFRTALAEAERHPERRETLLNEMFEAGQMVRGSVAAHAMAKAAAVLGASEQEVGELIRELQDAQVERDELRERFTLAQADPQTLAPQLRELEQKLQEADGRVGDLERKVQAAAPRYNQLIDKPVSAPEAVGALKPGEAIVQIFLGSEGSLGFYVDGHGIKAYEIDLTEAQARDSVKALRHPLEVKDRILPFPIADAHALYLKLLGPVSGDLRGVKHLVTVPGGPLLSLPFGILVEEASEPVSGMDYSAVPWMARRCDLTLAPSVQSFVNLRKTVQPSQARAAFIGFGDFVPHGDPDTICRALGMPASCRGAAEEIAGLGALPGTAQELREVASALTTPENTLVMGPAFSEPTLRRVNLRDYHVVYFATHGLLPEKVQCLPEPALVLSASSREKDSDDGLLMSSEAALLKLDADLVVLSACDTGGAGEKMGGEALSGLARSFLFAGARSLLVTHWEIPDVPTARLLTRCFDGLANQNLTLAEALRNGQTTLIENPALSHPVAWGAFTVVGDGGQHLTGVKGARRL